MHFYCTYPAYYLATSSQFRYLATQTFFTLRTPSPAPNTCRLFSLNTMPIEGKRIICCLDGTWVNSDKGYNKPTVQQPCATLAVPSNVTRIYRSLRKRGWDGESQVMYYHPGVGSTGDISDMIAGGVFGIGVSEVRLIWRT